MAQCSESGQKSLTKETQAHTAHVVKKVCFTFQLLNSDMTGCEDFLGCGDSVCCE